MKNVSSAAAEAGASGRAQRRPEPSSPTHALLHACDITGSPAFDMIVILKPFQRVLSNWLPRISYDRQQFVGLLLTCLSLQPS